MVDRIVATFEPSDIESQTDNSNGTLSCKSNSRLRLFETVEEQDVDVARELVSHSTQEVGLDEDGT